MAKHFILSSIFLFSLALTTSVFSQPRYPKFKVLAFYSQTVEKAHVDFADAAIQFFKELTVGNGFVFDTTSRMEDLNDEKIKEYQLLMMINDFPHSDEQRKAFEKYMESGGGWLGFHVAAYNDRTTNWPWFVNFLGPPFFIKITGRRCLLNSRLMTHRTVLLKDCLPALLHLSVSGTNGGQAQGKIKKLKCC